MDFLFQLFNPTQSSFDPLNFMGLVGTILASIFIFRKQTTDAFVKERHDKLIFPLFDALESTLYQSKYSESLKKALAIIDNNKNLIDGKLLELHYTCSCNNTFENYLDLCFYVDKAYDKSCKKLGLKTRSIMYRIVRKQYKNLRTLVLYILVYTITGIFIGLLMFGLLITLLALFISIFNVADDTTKLLLLLCLVLFFFAIQKYVNEKS